MDAYSRRYFTTQIETANSRKLVTYLYDEAIRLLREARADLKEKRHGAASGKIGRTMDIVMELANALDFTASPQLASRLNALYNFIVDGLVESIRDRDPKRLRACEGLLATLAEAWRHVTRPQPSLPPKIDSNQYSRRTIALSA